jgi:hypothetical protein
MSKMRTSIRSGSRSVGGVVRYPLDRIYEEVAFIAYHFHWSREEILNLEHRERQRWVEEISKINRQLSGEKQKSILEA